MENVELMWNTIKTKILEGTEKYIPVVLPFSSWKKKKWKRPLPNDTRELIKQKNAMWKRYIRTKGVKILNDYKKNSQ